MSINGAISRSDIWFTVRAVVTCLSTVALLEVAGCARNAPVPKSDTPPAVETRPSQAPEPLSLQDAPGALWAQGDDVLTGLDGAPYDIYRSETIERVQTALRKRGFYAGPVNGMLDRPTMESIYTFQKANDLQRCGVPTPHTRKRLEQGSHTDRGF